MDEGGKSSVTCGILVQMDCGVVPLSEGSASRLIVLEKLYGRAFAYAATVNDTASGCHRELNPQEFAREHLVCHDDSAAVQDSGTTFLGSS